ncbi:unnamed protein product, partial [marine sediment metagenome]
MVNTVKTPYFNKFQVKTGLLALTALATLLSATIPALAALPNQRTELKVLLLSADDTEPTTHAWEAEFKREGVPYEKLVLVPEHVPLTSSAFADTLPSGEPHAKYQAVVIATGGLVYFSPQGTWTSALTSDEWSALNNFESTYGIRQITAFTYPMPSVGLN